MSSSEASDSNSAPTEFLEVIVHDLEQLYGNVQQDERLRDAVWTVVEARADSFINSERESQRMAGRVRSIISSCLQWTYSIWLTLACFLGLYAYGKDIATLKVAVQTCVTMFAVAFLDIIPKLFVKSFTRPDGTVVQPQKYMNRKAPEVVLAIAGFLLLGSCTLSFQCEWMNAVSVNLLCTLPAWLYRNETKKKIKIYQYTIDWIRTD